MNIQTPQVTAISTEARWQPAAAMEIAEFLDWARVSRTTAYREMKAGRLRARKVGAKTVILRDEAEQWLRSLPCAA